MEHILGNAPPLAIGTMHWSNSWLDKVFINRGAKHLTDNELDQVASEVQSPACFCPACNVCVRSEDSVAFWAR